MEKSMFDREKTKDIFDYQYLDSPLLDVYSYFHTKFTTLFDEYSTLYGIDNNYFYIQNNILCNAFAKKSSTRNIIAITNGYPIQINNKLSKSYFENIVALAFINEKDVAEAFCDLVENNFQFNKFFLDCSIQFTFSHEFQHVLQMNYGEHGFYFQENYEFNKFDLRKHVWEFDADRMGSYEVLKLVFSYYKKLDFKSVGKLKCMLILGCTSMVLTQYLFYLGIINQVGPNYKVTKQDFYTKQYSHPHPLVRTINILEFYFNNISDDFASLSLDSQTLLINCIGFLKLYFESFIINDNVTDFLFGDLELYIDAINEYNQELYDSAVQDETITGILNARNIIFE